MAQVVIADAGPLIALLKADLVEILGLLFETVTIPPAVEQECLAKDSADSQCIRRAIDAGMLSVVPVSDDHYDKLPRSLGDGEKQALGLAARFDHPLLIMDDRLARKQARKLGIRFIGTVRLLVLAEQRDHIESAASAIEMMRTHGYRISLDLLREIQAKE